ncbi:MAG: ABC transporter permease [Clostridia bacterium]|nr:ABC transporter permease [Clostridia bacterium]MBN2883749.1 ABC transporter permease [Clostridia bacterium]
MNFLQSLKMAVTSIYSNKGRSFLTMLGVIIGVAAVIAATGFALGSTSSITDSIESLGANKLSVNILDRNSNRDIDYEDFKAFTDENADLISMMAPTVNGTSTVKYQTTISEAVNVIGTSPDYAEINDMHVQDGRYILELDMEYRQKIAVIGTAVANEFFGRTDPIGETIKLDGTPFTIVGVLEQKDGGQDGGEDDVIIIPVTTAQRVYKSATIRTFTVLVSESENVAKTQALIEDFLFETYLSEDAYRVFNSAQILDTLEDITGTMALILGGIAVISLLVGGIGIMNIMLVSVTERTREIGIRKAIGARKSSILSQFMIEALVITGLGGLIGIVIGVGAIFLVISNFVPPVIDPMWMVLSFGFSLLIGLLFGIFPAYKAANLNPIEALRYE